MNKPKLRVTWFDANREPQCPPNPAYPKGVDIDLRLPSRKPVASCSTDLPYPAKRCGAFIVECLRCGMRVALTTAGRPDDPRSVIVPCKLRDMPPLEALTIDDDEHNPGAVH
jgi:hypothetical protein